MIRLRTIRTRLIASFGLAIALSCLLVVACVYVGMRFVPHYEFVTVPAIERTGGSPPADVTNPPRAKPVTRGIVVRSAADVLRMALLTSAVGMLAALAVGLVTGRKVVRHLLAPLEAVHRAVTTVGTGNLDHRIRATGPADELKELACAFDTMLDDVQRLFTAHQRFAANASHELLTPLTTTRSLLHVLAEPGSPAEFAELLPMLVETNERNISTVTALLELARAEHTGSELEDVHLGDLTRMIAAERASAAQATQVDLHIEQRGGAVTVTGNLTLLRQMVLNLLDNAVTYNHPGGQVKILVGTDRHTAVLEVRNTGPRVDPSGTDRLFEPFYRSDQSRMNSDRSGHGLGLTIVRNIVRAHHGSVTAVANPDGGLTVRVEIPRAVDD